MPRPLGLGLLKFVLPCSTRRAVCTKQSWVGRDICVHNHIHAHAERSGTQSKPASHHQFLMLRQNQNHLEGKLQGVVPEAESSGVETAPPWASHPPSPHTSHIGELAGGTRHTPELLEGLFSPPNQSCANGITARAGVRPLVADGLLGSGWNAPGTRRAALAASREPPHRYQNGFAARSFTKVSPGRELSGGT